MPSRRKSSGRTSSERNNERGSRGRAEAKIQPSLLPQMIQDNATLQSRNQLLLMYSSFQAEMPSDGSTRIGNWIQAHLQQHGLPSLIRFGPRYRPQVLRRDEFIEWFHPLLSQPSS